VADYADNAVFITPTGVRHGREGVREAFAQLLRALPNASWTIKTTIYEGDVLLLEGRPSPRPAGWRTGSTRSSSGTA
jgi:predicted SnoaL-like aldol condensation-catalyzing enzyme